MPETNDDQSEPRYISVDASPISWSFSISEPTVQITPADRIEVEDADNLKYLRLRSGDICLPQAVFIVVEGERFEITQDELPSEAQ